MSQFFEHLRFDVASGDYGNVELCVWQLVAVKEKSCKRYSPAGFGNGLRGGREQLHRLADFVFADSDDVVDILPDVFEVDGADALGAEAVGNGARHLFSRELNDFSGAQAGVGVSGEFGFDTDYFC